MFFFHWIKGGTVNEETQKELQPSPPSYDFTLSVSCSLEMGREGMEVIHTIVEKISTSQIENIRDCLTEIQKRRRRNTLVEINISSVQLRPVVRKMLRDVIEAFDKGLEEFEKRVLQIEVNIKINLQIKSQQHNFFCKIISPF